MKAKIILLISVVVVCLSCKKEDNRNGVVGVPSVQTNSPLFVYSSDVGLSGRIVSSGASELTEKGFCWSTSPGSSLANNSTIIAGTDTGLFSFIVPITNPDTIYFRAYAKNSLGTGYGSEVSVIVPNYNTPPTLDGLSVNATNNVTFQLASSVLSEGSDPAIHGFVVGMLPSPTLNNSDVISFSETGTGGFDTTVSLMANSTYYIRAFAQNSAGITYSVQRSIVTSNPILGSVVLNQPVVLSCTEIEVSSVINSLGGDQLAFSGFCWSTQANPTISNNTQTTQNPIFSSTDFFIVSGLMPSTTYHFRAFVSNAQGVAYSQDQSITTDAQALAVVGSIPCSQITYSSAFATGTVDNDGCSSVISRGFCYSTNSNPTINNSIVNSGSGIGLFSTTISNLNAGTTYHLRPFAQNASGFSYGSEVTFTTLSFGPPSVATLAFNSVTSTSATISGSVSADGGSAVITRGVCYSTTTNPTISNSVSFSGSGLGSFSCNLSGLASGTTYYVRAFAINSFGTGYGSTLSFTTP